MRRLFVPADKWVDARVIVADEAHRHLSRVLRARSGDTLTLFDGQGREVDAVVVSVERERTTLSLGAPRAAPASAGARILLLQSLARGERMDWIVQKTTELGVAQIVPVAAERSVVRVGAAESPARRARWQKIAREAARQCGRADVPAIAEPIALAAAVEAWRADPGNQGGAAFVLWEGSLGQPLRAALAGDARTVALLIGPEGGFTDAEVASAEGAGFQVAGLGPRILRVETAAVVAVALAQFATGGLD
jgi:16S rRNA (uracil1498-N3)-methyltransferase